MKKVDIDFNAPILYKIQILQEALNELLEIMKEQGIIELEVDEDGRNEN